MPSTNIMQPKRRIVDVTPEKRRDLKKLVYRYTHLTSSTITGITKRNAFMSPRYPALFKDHDTLYKSVTHYMEAQRYRGCPAYQKLIIDATRPMDAYHLGTRTIINSVNSVEREEINRLILEHGDDIVQECPEWMGARDVHFVRANHLKFAANDDLKRALIATYPHEIIEESDDLHWGAGYRGRRRFIEGQNKGGKLLEIVRYLLMKEKQ